MAIAGTRFRLARMSIGVLVVFAFAIGGSQAALGKTRGAAQKTATPSVLRIGLSSVQDVFDPAVAQPVAKPQLDLLFDHLVGLNATETAFDKSTGVASNWTTKDYKSWTFTIRPGMTFSNGEKLTAKDVAFSIGRLTTKAATSAYSTFFKTYLDKVHASNTNKVTIILKQPQFGLLYYLSSLFGNEGDIIPHTYFAQVGAAGFTAHPIGSGPYKLAAHTPGVSLTFVPSGTHTTRKPKYKQVTFSIIPDSSSRIALYKAGQLDVVDIGTSDAGSLNSGNSKVVVKPVGYTVGIGFFEQWKSTTPFNNQTFRQALSLAVDANAINKAIFHGLGKVTGNYPSGCLSLGCVPLKAYTYNPTKAKQLLAQSGYKGQQIPIYAFPLPGVPELPDVATAVQAYWSAIGVNAQVVPTDYTSFLAKWVGYTVGTGAAPVSFAQRPLGIAQYDSSFWSQGGSTFTHDSGIDSLENQAHAAGGNPALYGKLTGKLDQWVYNHYESLPLVAIGALYAAKTNVAAGWSPGDGQYDMNIRGLATTG